MIGSGHEHQILCVGLSQKGSAKIFWLDYHDASTLFLDIPIHCRIADERVSHKFDLTWFTVEEHMVAFFNLFARFVGELQCRILLVFRTTHRLRLDSAY